MKKSEQLAFSLTLAVSDDGTKAIVISRAKLAEGAVEGHTNTYLRDVASGQYTTMTTTPSVSYYTNQIAFFPDEFVAGTHNFDHVLLLGRGVSFLPGAPVNALYEFSDGQLRVASVLPDGTATSGAGGITRIDHDPYRMSEDGSRIFFTGGDGAAYVRLNGTATQVVSASHHTGDTGTVQPGEFLAATSDGRHAYIYGHDLTDDSEPGLTSLYRYSVDDDDLTLLTEVSNTPGVAGDIVFGSAVHGDTIYFLSSDSLLGNPSSGRNIYVWRNGALALVASLDLTRDFYSWGARNWRVSPNGRYLIFAVNSQLTEYDNSIPQPPKICNSYDEADAGTACREIYRYDADADTLLCASCRPDGKPPAGHSIMGQSELQIGGHTYPRGVTDSGQVFFDTPDPLVARDTNGTSDVYEFDGSEARLISTGSGGKSQFEGASLDGTSVFITTQNQLVKADTDNATDLYVARVGGGIASQNPEPAVPCSGEGCRGAAPSSLPPPPTGSEAISGPGNASARKKQRCGKGRQAKKVKGKSRCVKQRKANNNRRQGR